MPARRNRLLLVSVLVLMSGCGKKGPLLYPDMLVAQPPQQLKVEQSGSRLRLTFDLPEKDLSGRKLEDLEAVLVGRRVYQELDCISCQDQYQNLQKIDPVLPAPAQRHGNRIVLIDADVRAGERYQYRLQTVQKGGITGNATVTAVTALLSPPAAPGLKASVAFGGFVVLDITGMLSQGTSLVGYTVYRAEGDGVLVPITSLASDVTHYEDQSIQRNHTYRYAVSTVVKRSDGVVAESELSAPVTLTVADDPG